MNITPNTIDLQFITKVTKTSWCAFFFLSRHFHVESGFHSKKNPGAFTFHSYSSSFSIHKPKCIPFKSTFSAYSIFFSFRIKASTCSPLLPHCVFSAGFDPHSTYIRIHGHIPFACQQAHPNRPKRKKKKQKKKRCRRDSSLAMCASVCRQLDSHSLFTIFCVLCACTYYDCDATASAAHCIHTKTNNRD